jgi:flagellar protein FliS
MSTDSATAYLRTKVMSASPEQLRQMLLEGALRFARQGRDGLARKDFEASYTGFTKCRNILMELMNVRPECDPDLRAKVSSLYTFLYVHLTEGGFEKDMVKVDRVIELLEFELETWNLAMQAAAKERGQGGPAVAASGVTPVTTADPGQRRALSIQA